MPQVKHGARELKRSSGITEGTGLNRVIDACGDIPTKENVRYQLLWAGRTGYLDLFASGYAAMAGITHDEFRERRQSLPLDQFLEQLITLAEQFVKPANEYVEEMEQAGVECAFILNPDQETTVGIKPVPLEVIAPLLEKYGRRLAGFAGVDPWKGQEAIRKIDVAVREFGFRGVMLTPFGSKLRAGDQRFFPIYTKCAELNLPVWVHTSIHYWCESPVDVGNPLELDRVASIFPNLKLIAGHGGWPWLDDMIAVMMRHRNIYLDTSTFRPRQLAAPGSGWEMFRYFADRRLQDQILFGSAWTTLGIRISDLIEEARKLPLREEVKRKWLYDNARTVLQLG